MIKCNRLRRERKRTVMLIWALVPLLTTATLPSAGYTEEPGVPGSPGDLHIQAEQIRIGPDGIDITATGTVRFQVGDLTIHAATARLYPKMGIAEMDAPFEIRYEALILVGDRLVFNAQKETLTLDGPKISTSSKLAVSIEGEQGICRHGTCSFSAIHGTTCPHQPQGYGVRAQEVTVHGSGDIDLTKPVVLVDDTPIAALPWIRLRPPDKPGFLFPRLGYDRDGGFVIGPAGYLPIGPNVSASGHIAVRTSEGFESRSVLTAPNFGVVLNHITHFPSTDLQLKMRGLASLNQSTAAMEVHLASSRKIIDDMAINPTDRALTHTTARGLLSFPFKGLVLETHTAFLQTFNADGDALYEVYAPVASVGLSLPSVPIARYFWPAFDLRLSRLGIPEQSPYADSVFSPVPSHTRIELSPRISVPTRFGPIHTQLHLGTRHQVWLPDSGSFASTTTHLAAMEIHLRTPVARRFRAFRHVIEPFLRYRLTPWQSGANPSWVVDDFDRLRTGQELDAGILTQFDHTRSPAASLMIAERIDLPGFGNSFAPAYLYGKAAAGPLWLRVSVDGAWDHTQSKPSTAGLTLSSRLEEQNRMDLGTRWIGPGRGPHLDRPFTDAFGPWLVTTWPDNAQEQLAVFQNLQISLTRRFSARIGSRIGVWPEPVLHALWYGVEFRTICGCLKAGLIASHRLASYVPDVLFTFSLAGL